MMSNRLSLLLILLCTVLGGLIYFETQPEDRPPISVPAVTVGSVDQRSATGSTPGLRLGRPEMPALADLTETLDRPLFAVDRKPPAIPDTAVQTVEISTPTVTGLPALELTAVIINGPQRMALLQGPDPSAPLIHAQEGQTVEGWLLEEVLPERVILRQGEQEHELILRKFKPPPQALLPAAKPKIPNIKDTDDGESLSQALDLRRPRRPLRGPRLRSRLKNAQ